MPRDGSGQFTLVAGNPVVPDTLIETGWANPTLEDIAQQLSNSLAADGQTTPVANLPMGGYRHTNVSEPTSRNQYNTLGMTQDGRDRRVTILSGTNNLTGSLVGGSTTYILGQIITFVPLVTNTGPVTLAINGGAPVTVLSRFENQLQAGDLQASALYIAAYDGSAFQLQSSVGDENELFWLDTSPTGNARPDGGTYPALSLASGTSINIPPGSGFVVPPGPEGVDQLLRVSWGAQVLNLIGLTNSFTSTITIDSNGTPKQHNGRVPTALLRSEIVLGMVSHLSGTATAVTTATPVYGDEPYYNIDIGDLLANNIASGAQVSPNGTNPLHMNITAGAALLRGGAPNAVNSPNYLAIPAATAFTFTPLAGAATFGAPTQVAPVGNYDPNGAGTITAIPGGGTPTAIHRLYYIYGTYVWVYGQRTWANLTEALSRIDQDRALHVLSPRLSDGVLVAEIVATKGTSDLATVADCAILNRGTVFYGIGSAGSIGDAPSDGNTYGRRNAVWTTVIGAAAPNVTGNVVVTKTNPQVHLVDSPTGSVAQGIEAFRGANKWWVVEGVQGDDSLYIRSHDPTNGNLRFTTEFDLANGRWVFPEEVVAPAASLTNGAIPGRLMPVGSFGLGAEGQAAAVADADTLTRAGYYWADGTTVNGPGAGTWALQHVFAGATTQDAAQFAVDVLTGLQFKRVKSAGAWSTWSAIGGTGGGTMKVQVFTASGTWIKPTGVTAIEVTLVGAGAGGGGAPASPVVASIGVGGGGGQVVKRRLPVSSDVNVAIGAGGAGGIGAGLPSVGGASTLSGGATLSAAGGRIPGVSSLALTTNQTGIGPGGPGSGQGHLTHPATLSSSAQGPSAANASGTTYATADVTNNVATGSRSPRGELGIDGLGGGGGGVSWVPAGVGAAGRGADGGGDAYQGGGTGGSGVAAAANTGGGGGAGWTTNANAVTASGGTGGSGICIISWWE
jgi:hypothetical protein